MESGEAPPVNAMLVGDPEGREKLATPALLVDLDSLEGNLEAAASICREHGIALRPHTKGHKCLEIARRQIDLGAAGLCCTTLAEAELMAKTGVSSILVTSPVVGDADMARLADLHQRVPQILCVVDDEAPLPALGSAARKAGGKFDVLVDVDVGQKRTGAPTIDSVATVALGVEATAGLTFAGIQAYYGHLQAIAMYRDRADKARLSQAYVSGCIQRLREAGLEPGIVSGGGTGTLLVDVESGVFTELQLGSYPLLDAQYQREQLTPDDSPLFTPSLFVRGKVVSARQPGRVTINVGMKAVSTDGGPALLVIPHNLRADYQFAGDEHGFLIILGRAERPALETAVELVPAHCDTTTNLHAVIHAVRGQKLEAIWPIAARGVW